MKKNIFICFCIFIGIVTMGFSARQQDMTSFEGPYLGQTPPGDIPEVFAPGVVSTDEKQGCSVFLEEGRLFLFNVFRENGSFLYEMELKNGKWTRPALSPLSSKYYDGDFTVAPNGVTLYFSSRRPWTEAGEPQKKSNIWKVIRQDSRWGTPVPLNSDINTKAHEAYPTVTRDGEMYYFTRPDPAVNNLDIVVSRLEEGKWQRCLPLGDIINTGEHEYDPCVAPDGSYLIFCSQREGGLGKDDIYISYRDSHDQWGKPIHLGDKINSEFSENRPYVTPDGQYFFFTSDKSGDRDIYWVDATFIKKLKPKSR